MRTSSFLFAALLACALTGCHEDDTLDSSEDQNPTTEKTTDNDKKKHIFYEAIALSATEEQMAVHNIDFAFNFFRATEAELPESDQDKLIISPLSMSLALSMIANGAAGDTRQEILNALELGDYSISSLNAFNKKLAFDLPLQDEESTLTLANSLWLTPQGNVYSSFKDTLTNSYNAEIRQEKSSEMVSAINKWVSENTNGLIPKLISELAPGTSAVLANALYFRAQWMGKFKEEYTQISTFTNTDGTESEVNLMRRTQDDDYLETDSFQMVRMVLGNSAFNFYVLLPKEGISLDECVANLNGTVWNSLCNRLQNDLVTLYMPKFQTESNNKNMAILGKMGIKKMFNDQADFSNMTSATMPINNVVQGINFSVDEKGMEAAAGTSAGWDISNGGVYKDTRTPKYVKLQRPFFFLVGEKGTGSVLFMGKVTKF